MKTPVPHAEVRVDLTAVRDNVAELRRRAADAEVLAVVKADGYGHGLVPSARAALAGGANWLRTAVLAEALQLRAAGVPGRIWPGWRHRASAGATQSLPTSTCPAAVWAVDEIAAAARELGRPARLHLKSTPGWAAPARR